MSLKGTKTEDNLKAAFSGESQANRRYLYFAQKADVEGYNDVAAVRPPKGKRVMPMGTSSSLKKPAIRQPASRLATPAPT
jgi:hypothetical protein